MYYDLNLGLVDSAQASSSVHRDRLSQLLCNGYGAAAACLTVEGRVADSDRYVGVIVW